MAERNLTMVKSDSLKYDKEADCLYVNIQRTSSAVHCTEYNISPRQSHVSFELSRRIAVDLDRQNRILGVEIIDASKVISSLFHKKIAKDEIRKLLCRIDEQDTLNLRFEFRGKKEEHASLAIPKFYKSPVLSVS